MTGSEDFDGFAEAHAASLARLAYRLTGHRETARDLVQEVLLDTYRQWAKVLAAGNRSSYVHRMMVNRHLNARRRRVVAEVSSMDVPERALTSREQLHSDALDERDAMWRALADLSARQRTVLVLRFYEGLDDDAIADIISCRRTTVRSLAARGLSSLRKSPHLPHPAADETAQRST